MINAPLGCRKKVPVYNMTNVVFTCLIITGKVRYGCKDSTSRFNGEKNGPNIVNGENSMTHFVLKNSEKVCKGISDGLVRSFFHGKKFLFVYVSKNRTFAVPLRR